MKPGAGVERGNDLHVVPKPGLIGEYAASVAGKG
jgi:hypothetical protein